MAISCEQLFKIFKSHELTYFTGVPDSTFNEWMSYLADHPEELTNRIAANEGAAIAHAAGYHLATGKTGVVYLQNSGLGNCVNPLTSLADKEVYGIPMILMIGWRGEPGVKDEPQHKKMGRIMSDMLETLEIPYKVAEAENLNEQIAELNTLAVEKNIPVALVVKKGLLESYTSRLKAENEESLSREEAIQTIMDSLKEDVMVVATTGKTSRELFEYQQTKNSDHSQNFYTVGSMGHASAIALELAAQNPEKKVFILDGDGALIMHMGNLATIGYYQPKNLVHIVFDNASHESTGGQPTVSASLNIADIAHACGYEKTESCSSREDLEKSFNENKDDLSMVVVRVRQGSRKGLGRPTLSPEEMKNGIKEKSYVK